MDEKNHHAEEKAHEENIHAAEVVDFGEGSFALILPEKIIHRLGWREGEEIEVSCEEGKISIARKSRTAE